MESGTATKNQKNHRKVVCSLCSYVENSRIKDLIKESNKIYVSTEEIIRKKLKHLSVEDSLETHNQLRVFQQGLQRSIIRSERLHQSDD
jgi:hypothetical protein